MFSKLSQCLSLKCIINGTCEFNADGQPWNGLASHPGGVEILLVTLGYINRHKFQPDGPTSFPGSLIRLMAHLARMQTLLLLYEIQPSLFLSNAEFISVLNCQCCLKHQRTSKWTVYTCLFSQPRNKRVRDRTYYNIYTTSDLSR